MRPRRVIDRLNARVADRYRLLVLLALAGFVVGVYVVVVVGGGSVIGRTESPSVPLSVLATAVVALLFAPVQAALERLASSRGHGAADTPYDVLSRFSETVTGGYATEELPGRMSMLLAQGTGAAWAQVWLTVADRLTLAATWPVEAEADRTLPDPLPAASDAGGEGRRTLAVRHGGELLGVLRLQERPGLPLTSVEVRLFTGLAAQAGLMLRLVGLRAELEHRHEELRTRADELSASRERLIETQDTERRRLERDIHDGAQQHLVALAVNLRLVQAVAERSPERAALLLGRQAEAACDAIETLASLSRGIYPRVLSDEGLLPALRSTVATSTIPVVVVADDVGRLPAAVEAALYFCGLEAIQNAVKHSGAGAVTVHLGVQDGQWRLAVTDDGTGFDPARTEAAGTGAGLANMRDRLDAVGGTVTLRSGPGSGATMTALVPCAAPDAPPAGHIPVPLRRG